MLALVFSFPAHATISQILNAASYQPVTAPNAWAVAIGTALAPAPAIATADSQGQWPTTLGNITVQVSGQTAELYYVSPTQINFLVPALTTLGSLTVIVTNTSSGATQSGVITVQNTSPGLFSMDSTGSGPGAIENGATFALGPFLVETPQNGGNDLRTRLAVYCTGIRYAGNPTQDPSVTNVASAVTAQGIDTAGNQYSFTVEFAGANPVYPGLDQVNIVLPAQLDGAGTVSLTIATGNFTSNTVTFQVNSLPTSEIRLVGLTLSPTEVTGGAGATGTVSLNGRSPSGGFPLTVRSSLPTTQQPNIVLISQGQVSATFTVNTPAVAAEQTAVITTAAGNASLTASLQIDPSTAVQLSSFTVTPASVQGGASLAAAVALTAAAVPASVNVQIASDNTAAQPPAKVTVPANSSSASFTIPTSTVNTTQTTNLTATLGGKSLTQSVTIVPVLQLTLANTSVNGGTSVTGTLTLGKPAPASGVVITLTSSASSIASIPGSATIPVGQVTTTFTVSTFAVTAARTVTLTATYAAAQATQTVTLTVNPPAAGQLQSVTVSPTQVTGGSNATGTVTLSGPAQIGGLFVQLSSNNVAVQVPTLVNIAQGQTSASFSITTSKVASARSVIVTATAGGITETAMLTVN